MADDVIREVEQFLYREARMLDERRFHDWLALFTNDIHYWMGARANLYPRISKAINVLDRANYREDDLPRANELAIMDESKTTLSGRVACMDTGMAWAGPDRLVWEGWLDTSRISASATPARQGQRRDLVMRLDFYVGERDLFGVGFSDNVIFRKQYYIRVVAAPGQDLAASFNDLKVYLYRDENFAETAGADELKLENGQWRFKVEGTGFEATLGVTVARVEA